MPESPRWLYLTGKRKEADKVMEKFAKLNNKTLPKGGLNINDDVTTQYCSLSILLIYKIINPGIPNLLVRLCGIRTVLDAASPFDGCERDVPQSMMVKPAFHTEVYV